MFAVQVTSDVAVPESDRLAEPLGHLLHMLSTDLNLSEEIVGDTGYQLDRVLVHDQLENSHPAKPEPTSAGIPPDNTVMHSTAGNS